MKKCICDTFSQKNYFFRKLWKIKENSLGCDKIANEKQAKDTAGIDSGIIVWGKTINGW